jgi:hypothetical protein
MTERQQELNYLWSVYRCAQYEGRKLDWNGKEHLERLAAEVVAHQGYLPPGFVDGSKAGGLLPLKFRKPTAPYSLVKVIVDRFSGLLFSENQHPEIVVEGDPLTEDWLRTVAQIGRLWQQMHMARTYGGAQGSTAVGFQFVKGKPVFEVHDPRWLFPEFVEHGSMELASIEKRYRYFKEELDPLSGKWERREYWYRRIIDAERDVLFAPAPVERGDVEPDWQVASEVVHGFGFCPVVWVQNMPLQESEDGDPDCSSAVYESVEAIDALIAQANRAILFNTDPTLVIVSKAEFGEVRVGSDNAMRIPEGSANYLELNATGPKAAMELADQFRKNVLEMAACVLEHPDTSNKTATEVERMYQAMLSKADVFREQYGQRCIVPLLEMVYRAADLLQRPTQVAPSQPPAQTPGGEAEVPADMAAAVSAAASLGAGTGATTGTSVEGAGEMDDGIVGAAQQVSVIRRRVILPPRYVKDANGQPRAIERVPGTGGTIQLKWPGYFQPSLDDVTKAVTASVSAFSGGVIDDETAVNFVAPYFKVEDKAGLVQRVRDNAGQQQADLMAQMLSAVPDDTQQQPKAAAPQEAPTPSEG